MSRTNVTSFFWGVVRMEICLGTDIRFQSGEKMPLSIAMPVTLMHNACNLQKLRPSSRWGAFLLTHLIFMGQIRNKPCCHGSTQQKPMKKTALGLNSWCSRAAKVVLSCVVSVGISYTGVWAQSLISATSAMSADMNLDSCFLENALILSTFRGLYEVYRGLGWVQDASWYIIICT